MTKEEQLEQERHDEVEERYNLICSRALPLHGLGLQCSVENVRRLEKLTGTDFSCTEDMHQKVWSFLAKRKKPYLELKKYRKAKGYSTVVLAGILGVSREHLSRMENGANPLNSKALELIFNVSQNDTHASV